MGYHGADLSEADKIETIRNAGNIISPRTKRYFDESDNEDESFYQTMINLKKSIGSDHHIVDYSKNSADKTEQMRSLGVKAVVENLHPHHETEGTEAQCETKSETDSLVQIEFIDDLRVSDLSVGDRERQSESEWKDDGRWDDSVRYDETDNAPNSTSYKKAVKDLNSSSPKKRVSIARISENAVGVDEGNAAIEYAPKSHIGNVRPKWFRVLCCGTSDREVISRDGRLRFNAVREYFRTMTGRFSQWLRALAE